MPERVQGLFSFLENTQRVFSTTAKGGQERRNEVQENDEMEEQKFARFMNLLEENLDMINALAQMWDADLETVITEIFETGIHVHAYVLEMMADEELENLTDKDEDGDEE